MIFKLICFIVVILQTLLSIQQSFFDGKTVKTIRDAKLDEIEFPVTFNIIVKSAFDKEKLVKHGFNDTYTYFTGTKYRGIGWAGNGSNVSGKYIVGDLSRLKTYMPMTLVKNGLNLLLLRLFKLFSFIGILFQPKKSI